MWPIIPLVPLLMTLPLSAEGEPLPATASYDLAAVTRLARDASTSLMRETAEVALARAERRKNLHRVDPRLGLTARYTRISEEDPVVIDPGIPGVSVSIPGVQPDQWYFGVSLVLPVSDWLLRRSDIATAGDQAITAREALAEAAARRASLDAGLAYLGFVRAVRAEAVTRQTLADATRRRDDVGKRVAAKVASTADLALAEAQLAEVELALSSLEHARGLALTQVLALTDLSPDLGPESFSIEVTTAPTGLEAAATLLAEAWQHRPEPRALDAQAQAIASRRDLARVAGYPRLDLAANAQLVDPNPRTIAQSDGLTPTWDVSAVVSWSLDGLWQVGAELSALDAERQRLAADRSALDDGLMLEIAAAQRAQRDALARTRAAQAILAAATEAYRVRQALYAAGAATSLEVSEALTQLERARLGVVDADIALASAELQLRHATGRPL